MTELDLKQIRKRAMDEIEQNKKHPFHYEGDNFSDDVIDLLDRLEKAERKLEETTIELGKVCWESTAKINERDAQLENTESLIAQLTEEIAYGNKVITEKDAQLELAIELLNEAEKLVGTKTDALRSKELIWIGKYMNVKESLEKSYVDRNALTRKQARIEELEAQLKIAVEALEFFSVKSERAKEALREIKALEKVEVVE